MAKSLKDVKKGDKVYIKGFTGMRLGEFEVIAANAKLIKVAKKDGTQMTFDKATGKQTDSSNEKYANTVSTDKADDKLPKAEKPAKAEKAEKSAKKQAKKVEPKEEIDEDEDFEDELDEEDDDFEDEE